MKSLKQLCFSFINKYYYEFKKNIYILPLELRININNKIFLSSSFKIKDIDMYFEVKPQELVNDIIHTTCYTMGFRHRIINYKIKKIITINNIKYMATIHKWIIYYYTNNNNTEHILTYQYIFNSDVDLNYLDALLDDVWLIKKFKQKISLSIRALNL